MLPENLFDLLVEIVSQGIHLVRIQEIFFPAIILHLFQNVFLQSIPGIIKLVSCFLLRNFVALKNGPVLFFLHEYERILLLNQHNRGWNDASQWLDLGKAHQGYVTLRETKSFVPLGRENSIVAQREEDAFAHLEGMAGLLSIVKLARRDAKLLAHKNFVQAQLQAQEFVKLPIDCVPSIGKFQFTCTDDSGYRQDHPLFTRNFSHKDLMDARALSSDNLLSVPSAELAVKGFCTHQSVLEYVFELQLKLHEFHHDHPAMVFNPFWFTLRVAFSNHKVAQSFAAHNLPTTTFTNGSTRQLGSLQPVVVQHPSPLLSEQS
mmetsp:Transcript_2617/g.7208  ORF Transcript_2617/g.7208 Transcript_2617/m.7208 type:complete len:319 (-) Transcript_2617:90-1046(-)